MCSQDFNNWWLRCNKISDTLQRVPSGNAGVVCWKLYSSEAGSSFELLEPPCCCKPTAAKHWFAGKTYFSIALRGRKGKQIPFLSMFFDQLFSWRLNGIQIILLWSCVLGFCLKCFFLNWNTFPVNVFHFFFLVFCLANCVRRQWGCTSLWLHQVSGRKQYIPKRWPLYFLEKLIWSYSFFHNIKFLTGTTFCP